MTTKLTKPVIRELELTDARGNVGNVVVGLTEAGVELRRKGSGGRTVIVPWSAISRAAEMPGHAPIRFYGDAIGWLVEKPESATGPATS
jgi:hypothetical protein